MTEVGSEGMSGPSETPQGRDRVGYLGPPGTFSEEALLTGAEGSAVEPVALPTIYDTVEALRGGTVRWAIVPIENSLEGSINLTLDLLADDASEVKIVAEMVLRVSHSLIAAEMIALDRIETVVTHPQVPGQCTRLLHGELARARILPASSTAEAVRSVVAERRSGQAALGTELAARIYGGTVIRAGVQDREDNETRFVWLAGAQDAAPLPPLRAHPSGEFKTSLVFWGLGAERPGWLVRCLDEFARREINLTKIESRPRRERLGSYMFFADLAAPLEDERVAEALAGLEGMCEEVRVLGSYPTAARPRANGG
jgi:prephenate dehydratase